MPFHFVFQFKTFRLVLYGFLCISFIRYMPQSMNVKPTIGYCHCLSIVQIVFKVTNVNLDLTELIVY